MVIEDNFEVKVFQSNDKVVKVFTAHEISKFLFTKSKVYIQPAQTL